MEKDKRRKFSDEQKVVILKKHLAEKVPVAELCREYDIHPSQFYGWQAQLFDKMLAAFSSEKPRESQHKQLESKVELLEAKLAKKDAVIADISESYVQLKKELGEI
jgi:transposase